MAGHSLNPRIESRSVWLPVHVRGNGMRGVYTSSFGLRPKTSGSCENLGKDKLPPLSLAGKQLAIQNPAPLGHAGGGKGRRRLTDGLACRGRNRVGVKANHAGLIGVEMPLSRGTDHVWIRVNLVIIDDPTAGRRGNVGDRIPALYSGSKIVLDQVCRGRGRRPAGGTQVGQGGRKSNTVECGISSFSGDDRAHILRGCRLIRRHARTEKIGDGDGCDDQDDGHYDEQLDQGKTTRGASRLAGCRLGLSLGPSHDKLLLFSSKYAGGGSPCFLA